MLLPQPITLLWIRTTANFNIVSNFLGAVLCRIGSWMFVVGVCRGYFLVVDISHIKSIKGRDISH
jgi:hypothetical protein